MRTKPYAGENVTFHSVACWWRGGMWASRGRLYVTNKRIIFEGDDVRECIIYLDQTKSFRYKPRGWVFEAMVFITKEDNSEE